MIKRLIAAILCVAILCSLFTGFASAASPTVDGALGEVKIFNGGYPQSYLSMNGTVRTLNYVYFPYTGASGIVREIPAYCINPTTPGVPQVVAQGESIKYIANEASNDPKVVGIIANGYPHKGLTELGLENKYQAYYATKMALWCYLNSNWSIDRLTINPTLSGVEKTRAEKILAAAKLTYQRGMTWTLVPQPNITVTAGKDAAYSVTIDGEEYRQQIFTATSETWVCDNEIDLSFFMPDEVPAGTRIVNMENQDITKIRTTPTGSSFAGQFKVLYPADSVDGQSGSVQLSFRAKVYKYAIYYALCAETDKYGNVQRYVCDTDPQVEMKQSTFSRYSATPGTGTDEPGGTPTETTLIIKKVETGTNTPLAGAMFEIKAPDGTIIGSFASDANGKVTVPLTLSGQYVVTEKTAPRWHLLGKEPTKTITVNYGSTATLTFENDPYGSLRVEKIDADSGNHLPGAKVEIMHIESGATYTGTTDLAGSVCFDQLRPGAYQIRELAAPSGWIKDDQTYTVHVGFATEASFTLENKAKPGLTIIKYDAQTHTPLPNVSFAVYRDTVQIGTFATDEFGEINLVNLQPGTYLVKEVATDSGHVLNSTPQQIELTAGDGIKTLVFFNALKPGIHILKVDSVTMQPLPNAHYLISKVGGTFAKEYVTDENGQIDLSALEPGAYTVKEVKSPDSHLIDDGIRTVQLDPDTTAQFVFTDTRKPSLTIVKYDPQSNKYLPGATFRIGKLADSSHYLDRVTDTQGRITLDGLEPGIYSVVELAAPEGFVQNTTEYHVALFPGKVSELVVPNEALPNLRIMKSDAITGAPVPGVTFTVRKADSATLTTVTTDADGAAFLEKLAPGVYEVTEQSVPSKYLLDPTPQLVTLVPGKTAQVQFQNFPRPSLEIVKTDTAENPIADAVFTVTKKDGTLVGDFSTGRDGKINLFDLDTGYYIITEKSVPAPFILDPTPHEVFMVQGKNTSITLENKRLPDLTVSKVDSITKDPIEAAKFTVWYAVNGSMSGDLRKIGSFATDKDGRFVLKAVEPGWYRITETEPAPGYAMKEPSTLDVFMEADQDKIVTFENQPLNSLIIKKVDAVDGHVLQGAKFRVRYFEGVSGTGGTVIGEYETSAQGTIVITGLKAGTYIVEELQPPANYILDDAPKTVYLSGKEQVAVTVEFANQPGGGITITKLDSATKKPLAGAVFEVRNSAGGVVGNSNGLFTTDVSGVIHLPNLPVDTYVIRETKAPAGYELDGTPQTVKLIPGQTHSLTFYNTATPEGGLRIVKLDEETRQPIGGVTFEISHMDGQRIGAYHTDSKGIISLPTLTPGWYTVVEKQAGSGYQLDAEPRDVQVQDGKTVTLEITNRKLSNIIIRKVDSQTGDGLYGATFVLYDSNDNPVAESRSDQRGYAYFDDLPDGRFKLREIDPPDGYRRDDGYKTVYVRYGGSTEIRWENTADKGQIQIVKKSADYNSVNGLPAGSLLAGATFEIYNERTGNRVDTIVSGANGLAVSKQLPLARYTVREVKAPANYTATSAEFTAVLEYSGQIVRFEVTNKSASTGVSITKTGPKEIVGGQPVRYVFTGIGNTGNVSLDSFYWRDTLPAQVRLNKVVTGSYNQPGNYKIVYRVNGGSYRTLADNLSTSKVYTIDTTPAALGLKANERISEIMFAFGQSPGGFAQVEAPMLYCTAVSGLAGGSTITNVAEAGGMYNGQWVQAVTRWVTTVYGKPVKLPKTGY